MKKVFLINAIVFCVILCGLSLTLGCILGGLITKPEVVEKEVIKYVEVVTSEKVIDEENTPKLISLGMFTATAYCCENYPHICNDGDGTITATGTQTTVGQTIAVDPSVIPYGTEVIINGHTYIAEDTGGAIKGNRIDILFATHKEALDYGVRQVEVFVLE